MLKKVSTIVLTLMMVLWLTGADLMAQTRVRFARGRNSTTVSGRLASRGASRSYVLRASAGQTLTATLSSANGKVDFMQGQVHDTQFSKTLDTTGDVYVDIDNHGGATTYTLTISIQ
ncbi:MAG: hypothetical protein ABI954_12560 [Pyrinomonadaceae bacterium]